MTVAQVPIPFQSLTSGLAGWLEVPPTDVQNAFWTIAVGALCAICCGLVGCFLVLRRMSLLGDALSHSVLAGIAGVYLVTGNVEPIPMLMGALLAGVATAMLTQFVHKAAALPEDSSIGIVFTSLFAFGVVVVSQAQHVHLDLKCVLFGDLSFAGVNLYPTLGRLWPESFRTLVPALIVTLLFLTLFWKELRLSSFDPTLAMTLGFSTMLMHYLLTTVVAVVTVAAMEVVGLLVVALLIVPPAIARLLTDRLSTMLWLSCAAGVSCTTTGYLLALRWNSSAAGLTAVIAGAELLVAILVSPKDGLLKRMAGTIRLRIRICAEDVLAGLFRRQEHSISPETAAVASSADCYQLAGNGLLAGAALRWLKSRQLLRVEGPTMTLTDKGLLYGRSLVRSHRLWESYLMENFNLPEDHLHVPAEEMEHFIGPELQQQITEELAAPAEDPHGRSIPDINNT
ncbi:MAG: iron chelate uptake ABC transporter family permease subunit [Planctomycetaceae bacterium]